MPVIIKIADQNVSSNDIEAVFDFFRQAEEKFSTFKETSEISQINQGKLEKKNYSPTLKRVLTLAEETKKETGGYFNIFINNQLDPAGIVKGWAIHEGAKILLERGYQNFYVEIAGDIETHGRNKNGNVWQIGIENPFNRKEMIKIIGISNKGIATSGTYIQGCHIYNPVDRINANEIISITVIGPNAYEADRFATAAFAMGKAGLSFIEKKAGFEGYMMTYDKKGFYTKGFEKYVTKGVHANKP